MEEDTAAAEMADFQRRPDMVVASEGEMMVMNCPTRRSWTSTAERVRRGDREGRWVRGLTDVWGPVVWDRHLADIEENRFRILASHLEDINIDSHDYET
jgi:hypothetical protein